MVENEKMFMFDYNNFQVINQINNNNFKTLNFKLYYNNLKQNYSILFYQNYFYTYTIAINLQNKTCHYFHNKRPHFNI